ncbi:MFS transporter [Planctomicrobium sp. SH661]|uniref:MFS transporter n=1 Tax=Planctomicrobium sp. SH661 TaxID=3448124 RepID=UPI003F5BB648
MDNIPATKPAPRWTVIQSLVCLTAAIGFAFDTYELLMLPLIAPGAIREFTGAAPGTPIFQNWIAALFFVPAVFGAIFGLLGGWLTDRLGRRRVLTGSILLYAGAAFISGYSTSMTMLLICRCFVFVGVCVEFVAAVAWLAELFDDPKQRERVIGYTQAFASLGGLMVAFVNHEFAALSQKGSLPMIVMPDWAAQLIGPLENPDVVWRYTLMSGLFPAIPLILVRPFLPESPKWAEKKKAGLLKRPSLLELFTPALRRTTVVSTLLVGCSYGMAFGGLQQFTQIVRGLPEVEEKVKDLPPPKAGAVRQVEAAKVSEFQEVGGLAGRFLLAFLAMRIAGRRKLLAMFLVPALFFLPSIFWTFSQGQNVHYFSLGGRVDVNLLSLLAFAAGAMVIGQMSFWGNYLPRVFPLHLRGTGESMAANIGGRLIGTSFAWVTAVLAKQAWIPGAAGYSKIAFSAACVTGGLALVGCILTFFLPEPPPEDVSEAH